MPSWGEIATAAIAAAAVVVAVLAHRRAGRAEASANEIAATTLQLQLDHRHDALAPEPPPVLETDLVRDPAGHASLFAEITVPRNYRVLADATRGESSWRLNLPPVLWTGRHRFEMERWPKDRTQPKVEDVRLRFWPPPDGEGTTDWACPCGRTAEPGDRQPGHWEWRLPVGYHEVMDTVG